MNDIEDLVLILPWKPKSRRALDSGDPNLTLQSGRDRIEMPFSDEGGAGGHRMIPGSLVFSGLVPTLNEVQSAIISAYDNTGVEPEAGDIVFMTPFFYLIGGVAINVVGGVITSNSLFRVVFSYDDVDYVAFGGPPRLL